MVEATDLVALELMETRASSSGYLKLTPRRSPSSSDPDNESFGGTIQVTRK